MTHAEHASSPTVDAALADDTLLVVTASSGHDTAGLALPFVDARVVTADQFDAALVRASDRVVVAAGGDSDDWWLRALAQVSDAGRPGLAVTLIASPLPDGSPDGSPGETRALALQVRGLREVGSQLGLELVRTDATDLGVEELVRHVELVSSFRALAGAEDTRQSPESEAALLRLLQVATTELEEVQRSRGDLQARFDALSGARLSKITHRYWALRRSLRGKGVARTSSSAGRGLAGVARTGIGRLGGKVLRRVRRHRKLVALAALAIVAGIVFVLLADLSSPWSWLVLWATTMATLALVLWGVRRAIHLVSGNRRDVARRLETLGDRLDGFGDASLASSADLAGHLERLTTTVRRQRELIEALVDERRSDDPAPGEGSTRAQDGQARAPRHRRPEPR